jgi:hypothetical protein
VVGVGLAVPEQPASAEISNASARPGLGFGIDRLKIRDMRRNAEKERHGERFDCTADNNPNGVASFSPGLDAAGGLPWVGFNSKGCSTPTGLDRSHGSRAATPLGLNNETVIFHPRVARLRRATLGYRLQPRWGCPLATNYKRNLRHRHHLRARNDDFAQPAMRLLQRGANKCILLEDSGERFGWSRQRLRGHNSEILRACSLH